MRNGMDTVSSKGAYDTMRDAAHITAQPATYSAERNANRIRLIIFAVVALLHVLLILFFAINVNAVMVTPEAPPEVMKLTDISEQVPLEERPAPPPPPEPADLPQNAVESIAETMVETDTITDQTLVAPGTLIISRAPTTGAVEEYLPMHKISVAPVFSEREILSRLIYPPIAQRSGLEGMVYLELVIDRQGQVRQVIVLRETPADRGFGEAAVKAFEGLRCTPAEANGAAVGVRYRYPVRFQIRG
jgi:protein TonB